MKDWPAFFAALHGRVGETLSTGDWFMLDQRATDLYAALIGDLDPVHNDPGWAAESEWGGTIAVGTHGLAMVPAFLARSGFPVNGENGTAFAPVELGKVRFVASLAVGTRARETTRLVALAPDGPAAWTVTTEHTIAREGEQRLFMTAVFTARYVLAGEP